MQVPEIKTKTGKAGHDLNEVIRHILERIMEERGWSETRLAKELEIPQRSFNRMMKPRGNLIGRLSWICAALEMNPVAFFASHPEYRHEARSFMRFGKDALYDRFRTLLSPEEARRVVKNVETQKELGIFDICSRMIDGMIETAKAAKRKGIRSLLTDRSA